MGFEEGLAAFEAKSLYRIKLARRKTVLSVASRIILRTPVKTGRARGNWQTTIGSPADGVIDGLDPNGVIAQAQARDATAKIGHDDAPVFITNNLPYIQRLEDGASEQAPNGMVSLTIAEFDGVAEQAIQQARDGGADE